MRRQTYRTSGGCTLYLALSGGSVKGSRQVTTEAMRPLGDDPSGWKSCQANCSVGARHGGSGTAYSAVAGVDQCCREPMRPSGDDPSGWKSCWTGGAGDARRGTSTPAGHTGGEATDDSVDPADTRDDDADFQNLPGTTLHDGAGHSMDDITLSLSLSHPNPPLTQP